MKWAECRSIPHGHHDVPIFAVTVSVRVCLIWNSPGGVRCLEVESNISAVYRDSSCEIAKIVLVIPACGPQTGFEEVNGDLREADFWPGTTSRLPALAPMLLAADQKIGCRVQKAMRILRFIGPRVIGY